MKGVICHELQLFLAFVWLQLASERTALISIEKAFGFLMLLEDTDIRLQNTKDQRQRCVVLCCVVLGWVGLCVVCVCVCDKHRTLPLMSAVLVTRAVRVLGWRFVRQNDAHGPAERCGKQSAGGPWRGGGAASCGSQRRAARGAGVS